MPAKLGVDSLPGGYVPNNYTVTAPPDRMDDIELDADTVMLVAGVMISLIVVIELYPAWKRARKRRE